MAAAAAELGRAASCVCGWAPAGEAATDWIGFGVAPADGETG